MNYLISATYYTFLVVSRIFDKYRRTRLIFITCTSFVVGGSLIYTLDYSPYLLLAGRFISGVGGSLRPVIAGIRIIGDWSFIYYGRKEEEEIRGVII